MSVIGQFINAISMIPVHCFTTSCYNNVTSFLKFEIIHSWQPYYHTSIIEVLFTVTYYLWQPLTN